jgi:hypothetical protein
MLPVEMAFWTWFYPWPDYLLGLLPDEFLPEEL